MYTVEIYKADKRVKKGERLVQKKDYDTTDLAALENTVKSTWPASKGFRFEIHETYITSVNIISGKEFRERYDTPYYCSPSSETYWSM